ncbi:Neurotransmitter-gated ion-channel transmembrane region [Ostertagia ostertagi]
MFPFDSLSCEIVLESYSFNTDEVRLLWHDVPITMMEKVELPDFDLIGWSTDHQRLEYPNGIWDRAKVKFTFARRYGFYLFQSYFPTSLTVISSWVGFSSTITLGVSSLLALTFQFGNVLRHLPRVSYIKCLDVWMIFSVIFIFCTLVELAIVCQLNRWGTRATDRLKGARKNRRNENRSNGEGVRRRLPLTSAHSPPKESPAHNTIITKQTANSVVHQRKPIDQFVDQDGCSYDEEKKYSCWRNAVQRLVYALCPPDRDWTVTSVQVDRCSMIMFPLSFLVFNIVYWSIYFVKMDRPM